MSPSLLVVSPSLIDRPCADVAALGDYAAQQLSTVHIWVNNAGAVTGKGLLDATPPQDIAEAVGTNVLGSLLCCR